MKPQTLIRIGKLYIYSPCRYDKIKPCIGGVPQIGAYVKVIAGYKNEPAQFVVSDGVREYHCVSAASLIAIK